MGLGEFEERGDFLLDLRVIQKDSGGESGGQLDKNWKQLKKTMKEEFRRKIGENLHKNGEGKKIYSRKLLKLQ